MLYTDQFTYEIQLPNINVDKSISFVTEIKSDRDQESKPDSQYNGWMKNNKLVNKTPNNCI